MTVSSAAPEHAELPQLMDAKAIARELGITRSAAITIMRQLPKVEFDGLRKVYVRRDDLADEMRRRTRS